MSTRWRHFTIGFWRRNPALSPALTTLISGVALTTALASGLDYIALPAQKTQLSDLESAVPLDVWGAYMVAATGVAVLGWAYGRWWLTALGHAALAGIYAAFGVGVLLSVADMGNWYGGRPGFARLCIATVHAALTVAAWRNWDDARDARDTREELRE